MVNKNDMWRLADRCFPSWLWSLRWAFWLLLVRAEDQDDAAKQESLTDWAEAVSSLGSFVSGLAAVLLLAHLLLFPDWALRQLMHQYENEGLRTPGTVLSCHERDRGGDASSSEKLASPSLRFLVDVMYEACEHKYADNPNLKFRNPDAWERKRFVRTFEFGRPLQRGEEVEVLLLPGVYHTRSGCPTEVVRRILDETHAPRKTGIVLGVAVLALGVLLGLAVRQLLRLDDPSAGWVVLLGGVAAGEALSLLVCADRFFKAKRRRFNSAQPMVSSLEQHEQQQKQKLQQQQRGASGRHMTDDNPFRIPLHEFAGHARASERERF